MDEPGMREVEDQLEWLMSVKPRTGALTAVVRCAALAEVGDDEFTALGSALADAVRGGDLVAHGPARDYTVLLRGVHDLTTAHAVAVKLCAAANAVLPACVGVTLVHQGESVPSVLLRAQGALDMALEAGAGQVTSSPPMG